VNSWVEAGVPPKHPAGDDPQRGAIAGVDGERGAIKPGLAADIIAMPEIRWRTFSGP